MSTLVKMDKGLSNYSWPGNVRELRNVIEEHLCYSTTDRFLEIM